MSILMIAGASTILWTCPVREAALRDYLEVRKLLLLQEDIG